MTKTLGTMLLAFATLGVIITLAPMIALFLIEVTILVAAAFTAMNMLDPDDHSLAALFAVTLGLWMIVNVPVYLIAS